jgi:hypothetical protein
MSGQAANMQSGNASSRREQKKKKIPLYLSKEVEEIFFLVRSSGIEDISS